MIHLSSMIGRVSMSSQITVIATAETAAMPAASIPVVNIAMMIFAVTIFAAAVMTEIMVVELEIELSRGSTSDRDRKGLFATVLWCLIHSV